MLKKDSNQHSLYILLALSTKGINLDFQEKKLANQQITEIYQQILKFVLISNLVYSHTKCLFYQFINKNNNCCHFLTNI